MHGDTRSGRRGLGLIPALAFAASAFVWANSESTASDGGLCGAGVPGGPSLVVTGEGAILPVSADDPCLLAVLGGGRYLLAGPAETHARRFPEAKVTGWLAEQALTPLERAIGGGPGSLSSRGSAAGSVKQSGAALSFILALDPGVDLGLIVPDLESAGAEVVWVDSSSRALQLGLRVAGEKYNLARQALVRVDGLVWADLQPPVRLRNADSAWVCQSGSPGQTPFFEAGIDGEGQIIAVMDTGIDADHCFFFDPERGLPPLNDDTGTVVDHDQRKVIAVDLYWDTLQLGPFQWDDQGHGSHVAGSAAGDQAPYGSHNGADGMAPGAKLVIQDGGALLDDCADLPGLGCPVRPLEPVLDQARSQGARIYNCSWGDEENFFPPNRYTERTADIDRFIWENQGFLVFVAAGNAGLPDSIGSPATGKNVVAVGAAQHGSVSPSCVAGFSSRGWTLDGRIKPDVLAPGSAVHSASSDHSITSFACGVSQKSGTSMASPTAAGLAALVRQYFEHGYHPGGTGQPGLGLSPSAALIKAVLIASAVDLASELCPIEHAPSRDQGWGMIQLDRALPLPGSQMRLIVEDSDEGFTASGGAPFSISLQTTAPGPLKVVLVWTDPPSTSLAEQNLVNDLDLTIAGPAGSFLGNVLVDGVSALGGQPDRLNNVEVLWLPEAPAGAWTATVSADTIELGPQRFALVAIGRLAAEAPRRPMSRVTPSLEAP